jgi:hypothetical protein
VLARHPEALPLWSGAAGAYITGDRNTGWLLKAIVPRVPPKPFADTREWCSVAVWQVLQRQLASVSASSMSCLAR